MHTHRLGRTQPEWALRGLAPKTVSQLRTLYHAWNQRPEAATAEPNNSKV
jgi:hypothetical protein